MPSKVVIAVIAGRIEAAVSRRRRLLHSGRMVMSNDTKADPMKTESAKPIRTKVQFIGGALVGNRASGNPLGSGWTNRFSTA